KAILSARSTVFDAMFSHEECSESLQKRVEIPDIRPEVMEVLLGYIYSGDTTGVEGCAEELLAAADKVSGFSSGPEDCLYMRCCSKTGAIKLFDYRTFRVFKIAHLWFC